jgi:hypothetical protein
VQYVFDAFKFEGMPGIGPALETGYDLVTGRQKIHDFPLAFVSPLQS